MDEMELTSEVGKQGARQMTVRGTEEKNSVEKKQHQSRKSVSKGQLKREKERAGKAFEKSWKCVTEKRSKKPPIM
jgi:hypothetical protein